MKSVAAMSDDQFELPHRIDHYLAIVSKLYVQTGEQLLQKIVVNAEPRVHEGWTSNDWNGGSKGHALYLGLPEAIFLPIVAEKDGLADRLVDDLNKLHNAQNEYFAKVFIELKEADDPEWRLKSGQLLQTTRYVPEVVARRIWADGQFRLFLSHKSEVKSETATLKDRLARYGVSSFVAHADIHPTREWQDEIENALATMDGFVALMTDQFHSSNWTDQEVGYAVARGVPVVAVRLGLDPYGFIGKFQALTCTWDEAPEKIVGLLIGQERVFAGYVNALRNCGSFDSANGLSRVLKSISAPTEQQVEALVAAYNENFEVRGGWGFNGEKPYEYGPGLLGYIEQWTTTQYKRNDEFKIVKA